MTATNMTDSASEGWQPRIGERAVVTSTKEWASDWVDAAGNPLEVWIVGLRALSGGGIDVTVADEWPIRARPFYQGGGTDLSDGFIVGRGEQDDLAPVTRATPPVERKWFPHLDYAGEPMREGEFRDPYPMPEELAAASLPDERVRVAREALEKVALIARNGLEGHLTPDEALSMIERDALASLDEGEGR
jgi:hypothetical protein